MNLSRCLVPVARVGTTFGLDAEIAYVRNVLALRQPVDVESLLDAVEYGMETLRGEAEGVKETAAYDVSVAKDELANLVKKVGKELDKVVEALSKPMNRERRTNLRTMIRRMIEELPKEE